jgi:hypothetical protein
MLCGTVVAYENTGAFQCDIDIAPRQRGGVALGCDADRALAHIHRTIAQSDRAAKSTMDGVEFEQMCVCLKRGKIIDCDHLKVITTLFNQGAQDVSADAAKSVDCKFGCHEHSPEFDSANMAI